MVEKNAIEDRKDADGLAGREPMQIDEQDTKDGSVDEKEDDDEMGNADGAAAKIQLEVGQEEYKEQKAVSAAAQSADLDETHADKIMNEGHSKSESEITQTDSKAATDSKTILAPPSSAVSDQPGTIIPATAVAITESATSVQTKYNETETLTKPTKTALIGVSAIADPAKLSTDTKPPPASLPTSSQVTQVQAAIPASMPGPVQPMSATAKPSTNASQLPPISAVAAAAIITASEQMNNTKGMDSLKKNGTSKILIPGTTPPTSSASTAAASSSMTSIEPTFAITSQIDNIPQNILTLLQTYGPLTSSEISYNLPSTPQNQSIPSILRILTSLNVINYQESLGLYYFHNGDIRGDTVYPKDILEMIKDTNDEIQESMKRIDLLEKELNRPVKKHRAKSAREFLKDLAAKYDGERGIRGDTVYATALRTLNVDLGLKRKISAQESAKRKKKRSSSGTSSNRRSKGQKKSSSSASTSTREKGKSTSSTSSAVEKGKGVPSSSDKKLKKTEESKSISVTQKDKKDKDKVQTKTSATPDVKIIQTPPQPKAGNVDKTAVKNNSATVVQSKKPASAEKTKAPTAKPSETKTPSNTKKAVEPPKPIPKPENLAKSAMEFLTGTSADEKSKNTTATEQKK